jgi:hypothetical protein
MFILLDFLDYVALISHRFNNDYLPVLEDNNSKANQRSLKKRELTLEMKSMLELYSVY